MNWMIDSYMKRMIISDDKWAIKIWYIINYCYDMANFFINTILLFFTSLIFFTTILSAFYIFHKLPYIILISNSNPLNSPNYSTIPLSLITLTNYNLIHSYPILPSLNYSHSLIIYLSHSTLYSNFYAIFPIYYLLNKPSMLKAHILTYVILFGIKDYLSHYLRLLSMIQV